MKEENYPRKQSLNDDQIVDRQKANRLPSAGVPKIENYGYDGSTGVQVPPDVNEPTGPDAILPAPRNLEIISQTIRFAPDGTQFVTVVVEFDEVENAIGYESRIART